MITYDNIKWNIWIDNVLVQAVSKAHEIRKLELLQPCFIRGSLRGLVGMITDERGINFIITLYPHDTLLCV